MKKREQEAMTRRRNSTEFVDMVSRIFSEKPSQDTVVYPIHADEFDWHELRQGRYPVFQLEPPGGAGVSFVYFKRHSSVADLAWCESFRTLNIYRPR